MRLTTPILLAFILISCGERVGVSFEVPQPEGKPNEKSIPKKLIGRYLNVEDSSILIISSDLIVETALADIVSHKSELDSADQITFRNDTAFTESYGGWDMKADVVIKGDSIYQHIDIRDTIYYAQRGDVVRKFKGYYFLNHPVAPNDWAVVKLARSKKTLTLGIVWQKSDIENLRALTETPDSVANFRPSKRQLRNFLKKSGFSDEKKYIKLPDRNL
jgi:hypothetical protein